MAGINWERPWGLCLGVQGVQLSPRCCSITPAARGIPRVSPVYPTATRGWKSVTGTLAGQSRAWALPHELEPSRSSRDSQPSQSDPGQCPSPAGTPGCPFCSSPRGSTGRAQQSAAPATGAPLVSQLLGYPLSPSSSFPAHKLPAMMIYSSRYPEGEICSLFSDFSAQTQLAHDTLGFLCSAISLSPSQPHQSQRHTGPTDPHLK